MPKHCETFDHTADVGLTATGDTLEELFEALAEGLADLICPREQVNPLETRVIAHHAGDLEALAVDFLTQILVTIQSERFPIATVRITAINGSDLAAEISGEPLDTDRHEFHTEVKAVTYHQISITRRDDQWAGQVILDI
jgi:SHS2 domain-containing protein